MSKPICSVMMPTCRRLQSMLRTVASFLELAKDPGRVEIIVRVHQDDPETMAWALGKPNGVRVVMGDTEEGYGSIDKFINCMAAVSNGDWLWPAGDDHTMLSKDWDEVLARRLERPREELLLYMAKVMNWPNGKVPVMSRGLYRALGHCGHTGFCDCYVDSLTHFAKLQEYSGLEVRDEGLPPPADRSCPTWMANWAIYRGEENAHCFEMDKRKLGAVMGKPITVKWTPREAPEFP